MLSKLVVFRRLAKPFSLKSFWKPELPSLRFNSSESPCGPPAKPPTGSGEGSSKANPCSGRASGGDSGGSQGKTDGTLIHSEKINYCEGRRGRKRTSLYTKDTLLMHCEVWPIIAIVALDMCGVLFMILWISQTRDEVKYFKKSKNHIESLDLLHPPKRKLYIGNQQYKPMKELHEIYKAMKEGSVAMKEGRKCQSTCKKPYCRFF